MARGRKTLFRQEIIKESERLAGFGMTEAQISYVFGVSPFTLSRWKRNRPEFKLALNRGEAIATQQVQKSLFESACGYKVTCKKGFLVKDGLNKSHVEMVEEEVVFPPNSTSIIFWLKNKAPDVWRDVSERKVSGKIDVELEGEIGVNLTGKFQEFASRVSERFGCSLS